MKSRKASNGLVLQKGEYERKCQRGFIYKWRDSYGIQCSISAVTLQELREKERDVKIGQLEGRVASQQRKTVNDYYNLWYSEKKRSLIKQNVLSNYVYMYGKFVAKSFLGRMKISGVKKSDVKKLYGDLLQNGLAVTTVDNGIHTVLHQVIQVAVDDNVIPRNPADGVMKEIKKRYKRKPPKALTVEQQERFLEVIDGTVWGCVFGVMMATGMRVAEICALCWEDIDVEKGTIHVQRNFVYYRDNVGAVKGDALMDRRIQSTKSTAGDRLLPLNDKILSCLDLYKQIGYANTDTVRSEEGDVSGFVFANRYGRCHNQGTLNRALKRIVKEANSDVNAVPLPNLHCHLLRKTYCSNLCRSGVPLVVASKLMGHEDVTVTSEIYTDVQTDMMQSADAQLQAYLDSEHSKLIVKKCTECGTT